MLCGIGCSFSSALYAQGPEYTTPGGAPPQFIPQGPQGSGIPEPYTNSSQMGMFDQPGPWNTPQGLPQQGTSVREPFITHRFARVEYLNVGVKNPGNAILGAPVAGVDISQPFDAVDTFGDFVGTVQVPNLSGIDLKDTCGIRLTLGWEMLNGGSVEFSAFTFENAIQRIGSEEQLPSGQLYATSTLINGEISDGGSEPNLLFYNQQYFARFSSRTWGAGITHVWDPSYYAGIFEFRPLLGVRYLNLYEKLQQRGTFEPLFGDPFTSSIDTYAYNNAITSQFGFRLEAVTKYITFGVEPKIGWGANFAMAKVRTDALRYPTDPQVLTSDTTIRGTSILDLNGYIRFNVSDNMTLSLGYIWTYLGTAIRASDSTYYNDPGDLSQPAGITASAQKTDMFWRGFTVGGEIHW